MRGPDVLPASLCAILPEGLLPFIVYPERQHTLIAQLAEPGR